MSASVNLETTLSVIYTKDPEEPTSPEHLGPSQIWAATFTIENRTFSPELTNSSSETFQELATDLEVLLNYVFKDISGFLYVKVTSFEKGSIVCNFFIHTKLESSATAEDFVKVLVAAANGGKTGNYHITNIAVKDTVGAVKGEKPKDKFLLKVFGVAAFAGVVVLIIVVIVYKTIKRKRREREGQKDTYDVYPLNDFNSPNTEVEERKPALGKTRQANYAEMEEEGDEITPFYKPD
ncbi:hypothetical protein OS493_025479 [Desmophyllum pertusum]|uniref:SEA domain-containing protein n=1 Tax=Desmophyllum pertusum TaxID=174260 RepID=A0A9W9YLE3_9CNID|nr:hypothetical protein OS493_025479 [Desmophyllum pertusum]